MLTRNSLSLKTVLEMKDTDESAKHESSKASVTAQLHMPPPFVSSFSVVSWKLEDRGEGTECVHPRGHVYCRGSEKELHAKPVFSNIVAEGTLALIMLCSWHLIFLFILVGLFKDMSISMGTYPA